MAQADSAEPGAIRGRRPLRLRVVAPTVGRRYREGRNLAA